MTLLSALNAEEKQLVKREIKIFYHVCSYLWKFYEDLDTYRCNINLNKQLSYVDLTTIIIITSIILFSFILIDCVVKFNQRKLITLKSSQYEDLATFCVLMTSILLFLCMLVHHISNFNM